MSKTAAPPEPPLPTPPLASWALREAMLREAMVWGAAAHVVVTRDVLYRFHSSADNGLGRMVSRTLGVGRAGYVTAAYLAEKMLAPQQPWLLLQGEDTGFVHGGKRFDQWVPLDALAGLDGVSTRNLRDLTTFQTMDIGEADRSGVMPWGEAR